MADESTDGVTPLDRDVRSVLEEFSSDTVAMAAEIVRLRTELDQARLDAGGPPPEIILRRPEPPPGAPPPVRFGGSA